MSWILKFIGGAVVVIASFAITLLVANYLAPLCPRGTMTPLSKQFPIFQQSGAAFVAADLTFDSLADSAEAPTRSAFVVCEDNRLLGPAHSRHSDIVSQGRGRFSHWKGIGFVFSASDNSDPNQNGRQYWTVRP